MTAKEKLYDKYAQLLEHGRTAGVTVKSICDELGINRAAFYRSFSDIHALEEYVIRNWIRTNVGELLKGEQVREYHDGDRIALKFLKFLEDNKKYAGSRLSKLISSSWLTAAADEIYQMALEITEDNKNGVEREWLAYFISVEVVSWALIFFENPQRFTLVDDGDKPSLYVEAMTKLIDADIDPYEVIAPDKLDVMLTFFACDMKDGNVPSTVSALCKEAGVTRQAFYHHFSDIADAKKQTLKAAESYIYTYLTENAFRKEIPEFEFKTKRNFSNRKQFSIFSLSKRLTYSIVNAVFEVCRRAITKIEQSDGTKPAGSLYFHLFFYLCAFTATGFYSFYSDHSPDAKEYTEKLRKYRRSFPELDELIVKIGEMQAEDAPRVKDGGIKDRLFEKFGEHVFQKNIYGVNVGELCEEAGINRTTFYRNFKNMNSLTEYVIRRYGKYFVSRLEKDMNIRSFRDFDTFAHNFISLVEELRPYGRMGVFEVATNEWIYIFFDEVRSGMIGALGEFRFSDREWFGENIAYCMLFWLYYFSFHSDSYRREDGHLLDSYAESAVNIVEREMNPYDAVKPDKFDAVLGFVNCSIQHGRDPKNVSELCKIAKISRQNFYRHYKNLEQSRTDSQKFIEVFTEECLFRCAFESELKPIDNRFSRPYETEADFNLFKCSKSFIICEVNAVFNMYLKCVKYFEDRAYPDRGMYFHFFFYIVGYYIAAFTLLYDQRNVREFEKKARLLMDYRRSFPALEEMIVELRENIDKVRNSAN